MAYTRAIYLKNNTVVTITEEEYHAVKQKILEGSKFVGVQGELISIDSISRVGSHESSAMVIKYEENNRMMGLPHDGALLALREKMRVNRLSPPDVVSVALPEGKVNYLRESIGGEMVPVGRASDEDDGGPMYWTDQNGEKHYS